ncbi:helix-turn-helix domain-containing protein [Bacillus sp. 3255]|uniref:helix-turn-helix domain-containing protein n=1 Tax=Bacillus sp. 3255 TaxID=2817904 RepID=UPI00285A217C|nr:helix-turn-helix domain-containing protein [Bacillus sp. 3255]MDR6883072.1 transcriptional regulator with XRE-family HTH domain [Bacillus sp. 3255]
MSLGDRIKERRARLDMLQEQCADLVGVTRGVLSSYERNVSIPPSDVLGRLATALKTSSDFLLGLTEDPTPTVKSNELPDEDEIKRRKFLIEMEDILRKSSDLDEKMMEHTLRIMEVTFLERLGESKRKNK